MVRQMYVVAALFMLIGLTVSSAQAARYSINDVVRKAKTITGPVTVRGTVVNSVAIKEEFSSFKGQYDITDPDTSESVHVMSMSNPPANGVEKTVSGKLNIKDPLKPVLIEGSTGLFGTDIPWYLFAALGGLVLIAVVLIVLITRKPAPSSDMVADAFLSGPPIQPTMPAPRIEAFIAPIPVVPAIKICSKCQKVNTADSQWCEECGESLIVSRTERPRVAPTSIELVSKRNAATVAILDDDPSGPPVADMTVFEGDGAKNGTAFSLHKKEHTIGRSDDMNIMLEDEAISRKHASIFWDAGTFYLKDESSTSGTFLNGKKITKIQAQALKSGDKIQLGKTKLIFRTI